ncbi:MAG: hypothetical protein C0467_03165 [Planctomycetaceae bacterium]|nr:hypothetical protein [Planctomycetaceae bacterium]
MKWSILAVAVSCLLADSSPAQAQFFGGPVYRTSFGYGGGVGFAYQRRGFFAGGFGGFYSRSVVVSPFGFGGFGPVYYGGFAPRFPFSPVFPAIAPITPFGFGPGFLGPGWGVGPTFGWNPVWGGALGLWGPWTAPYLGGFAPPFFSPFGQQYLTPPLGWLGNNNQPNSNGDGVAVAGGALPRPVAAAPGPLVGAGGFVVIEPKRDFPPPGVIAPDVARVAAPPPPVRPAFRFDPFADPILVKAEKADPDPVKEVARLVKLGREAFTAGEYGTAIDRFNQAIAADAKAAEPHFLKAQAEFAAGGYGDAVAAIRAGLALDPTWPAGVFDPKEPYGVNAAAFAGHLALLRKVSAANPGEPTLAFLLGYQLWFIGEKVEAKKWFDIAEKRLAVPGPIGLFK